MDANQERMPGDAEAAAAIQGMTDLYGNRIETGKTVIYRRDHWTPGVTETGKVVGFHRGLILLETDTDIVEVTTEELMPF